MKILVTGGGGFLGAWIVRRLTANGHQVRIFDRSDDRRILREIAGSAADNVDWRTGDIASPEDVGAAAQGTDVAIHLAAVLTPACRDNPVRGAQINVIGTLNVFEAARRHGLKGVAYASSAGVFGPDDGTTPFPITHYGAFKLACEGSARAYWEDHKVPSIGFRPFIIYGPGREIGLTAGPSLACRAAARDEAYEIPFTGASDLIFVDDVAAAFEAAALSRLQGARVFNLLGEVATVDELTRHISAIEPGSKITFGGPALPSAAEIARDDIDSVLPGLPHTGLRAGLAHTIGHYRRLAGRR